MPVIARGAVLLGLAAGALTCKPSGVAQTTIRIAPCSERNQAQFERLRDHGDLLAAQRYLEDRRGTCDDWERTRRIALLNTLAELGDVEAFGALAQQLTAEGETGLPPAPAAVKSPVGEAWAGMSALHNGRAREARRRFARARAGFRRRGLGESIISLQVHRLLSERPESVFVSADDRFRTGASWPPVRDPDHHMDAVRPPYATFGREPWRPLHFLRAGERVLPAADPEGVLLKAGPPLRLVDGSGEATASAQETWSPLATPHGIVFVERSDDKARVVLFAQRTRTRVADRRVLPWDSLQAPQLAMTGRDRLRVTTRNQGATWLRMPSLDKLVHIDPGPVALSHNGRHLAAMAAGGSTPRAMRIVDADNGQVMQEKKVELLAGDVTNMAVRNDGAIVAVVMRTSDDRASLQVVDFARKRSVLRVDGPVALAYQLPVYAAEGETLHWGSGSDGIAIDLDTHRVISPAPERPAEHPSAWQHPWATRDFARQLQALAMPHALPSVATARTSIAWASGHKDQAHLSLWSLHGGWRLRLNTPHCYPAIGFDEDSVAAAMDCDGTASTTRVLVQRLGGDARIVEVPFTVAGLALSGRGQRLLAWGGSRVALYEPFGAGALSWQAPAPIVRPVSLAPDGTSALQRWATHFDIMWLPGAKNRSAAPMIHTIACSPGRPAHYVNDQTVRCGDELVDLRRPRAARKPSPSPPFLAVQGTVVTLLKSPGQPLARIYGDGARGAMALVDDRVDPMGGSHPSLHCRYGHILTPLAVCRDALVRPRALADAWHRHRRQGSK